MQIPLFSTEDTQLIAGVDEAGRGPLCGAVFAAAVILNPKVPILGLNDSKKLTEHKRDQLALVIKSHALAWSVASASVEEIDGLNILQASLLAMRRAVEGLHLEPTKVLVDGNQDPKLGRPTELMIKGDERFQEIAAASILAKTARDATMYAYDVLYPHYGFAQHKGYGTKKHLAALNEFGALPIHRRSFAPVKQALNNAINADKFP